MAIENINNAASLAAAQQAAQLAAEQAARAAEQAAQAAQAEAQQGQSAAPTMAGDGSKAAGEALMAEHAGPLGAQDMPPPPEGGAPEGGGAEGDKSLLVGGTLGTLVTVSQAADKSLNGPETTLDFAHHLETFLKDDTEGANKATREFVAQELGKAKTTLSGALPSDSAPTDGAAAPTGGAGAPTGDAAAPQTPEASTTPDSGATAKPGEAPATEEEPFNETRLGQVAGVAGGVAGALALPSQVHEAIKGFSALARGDVNEESIKAAASGTLGTAASIGGIAEGSGIVLKGAGVAAGALPALETVSKVAGPAGGALAVVQGGFDIYDGLKNGKTDQAIEGGAEVVGGGLLVASVACPPLAIAGGAILLGTAIYKDRKQLIQAGKDIGEGVLNAGKDEVQAVSSAVQDGVGSVVKAGSDLSKGDVVGAAVDVGKGAVKTAEDLGKGAVNAVEDVGKGVGHAISSVFSGW